MSDDIVFMDLHEFVQQGFLQEANRQFFHPLGVAIALDPDTGEFKVWDSRGDSEGWVFADEVVESFEAVRKQKAIQSERDKHRIHREALYGIGVIIQPVIGGSE